jgi:AraC-like DNA-binding protein
MQPRSHSTRSTLATWSAALLRAVEARGADANAIARELGIDRSALGVDARVPRETLSRLWTLAVAATGDPALGLDAPRHASQTTFHALGYAVLASATLKDAFERLVRYRRLVGDVLSLRIVELGDRYRFEIDVSADPGVPYHAVDAIASMCARQARVLHRPRVCNPLLVTFARPEPFDVTPYSEAFRAPVRFGAEVNALEYARADVEDPLSAGNAELARGNDEVLVRFLARLEQARVATRVQQALLETLPDGAPSKSAIAKKLGMSARNLQRHLADEGTTFKDVLNDARADLARTYVQEQRLSVTEIAFVLGFADTSAFSRAFKRWTGMSPRDWARRRTRAG